MITIAHDRAGTGSPLLLLHPLGADRHVWDPILAPLRAAHDVTALDLPGFGASPPLPAEVTPTPAALATAVAAFLAELGVERPHVVGNSLGGWIGLELGLTGVAGRVTAISPAGLWAGPLAPRAPTSHLLAAKLSRLVGPIAATGAGRRLLLKGTAAHPERVPAADAARLVRAYGRAPGFVATDQAMRAGTFLDLADVPCPVTLIWPEHDTLVKRPASLPANVTSLMLADAGHVPMWDAPRALVEMIGASDSDPGRAATSHALAQLDQPEI